MIKNFLDTWVHFTQRNNVRNPWVTCYNTSSAMAMKTELLKLGLKKTSVGCPEDMLLEDYIYDIIYSKECLDYLVKLGVPNWGSYMKNATYSTPENGGRQTLAHAQMFAFNKLMSKYWCKMVYKNNQRWEDLVKLIDAGKPQLIHGNFSNVSNVGGHLFLCTGYEIKNNKRLIRCNDPYGDGNTGYKNINGEAVIYDWDGFFIQNGGSTSPVWISSIVDTRK